MASVRRCRTIKTATACIAATLLWAGAALADPASGIRAYNAGLYDLAAQEFQREAKAGDAEAQFRLGTMYADGVWLTQSRDHAVEWLERAAAQGHDGALQRLKTIKR